MMHTKARIAWELMEAYEEATGLHYSRIIKTRTDLYLNRRLDVGRWPLDEEPRTVFSWEDIFNVGNRESMEHLCSMVRHLGSYDPENGHPSGYIVEEQLRYHLVRNGYKYRHLHEWNHWLDMNIVRKQEDPGCGARVPYWKVPK